MDDIKQYLDEDGRISRWPAKKRKKEAVIAYLATKFEDDRIYTEKEVNQIIEQWHTFGDYFMLRRGMIQINVMSRTKNGAEYWKTRPSEFQ